MGMKYKLLVSSSKQKLLEEIYFISDKVESISTSSLVDDIVKHLKLVAPDLFIVCISNDAKEWARTFNEIEKELKKQEVITVILAAEDEMEEFNRVSKDVVDLCITRPTKNSAIMQEIELLIKEREKKRHELQQLLEAQEKEKTRKHILVVDDDPNMLELLKAMLDGEFKVATAVNGGLALRYLSKNIPEMILLDYEMPVQSGPQVLKLIRGTESLKDVPVIFLTGVTDTAKIAEVLKMKPEGYLLKPVDKSKLMDTIRKFLGEKE